MLAPTLKKLRSEKLRAWKMFSSRWPSGSPDPVSPHQDMIDLALSELHGYTGASEGRILMSLAGEILDISAGRELYGPEGGYSLLAGHDVTRCLATMSLDPADLDDLRYASGPQKGPAERGHVKKRQKSSKSVKNICRHFSTFFAQGKNTSKIVKKCQKYFFTFRHFSRGTSFPAPFEGL